MFVGSSPDGNEFRGMVKRAGFYIAIATIGHLFWETAQLPFYTVWWDGVPRENLVAVAHCTSGDVLITATTLLIAALVARLQAWRLFGRRMVLTTIVLGVGYTMLSEWLNVEVLRSWSYSSLMPVLPWFGTGLSPVLQWIAVPFLAFSVTARMRQQRQE
jgi:hypothetical protein